MKSPVSLDPSILRPREGPACVCPWCGKERARWYTADGAAWVPMCSLCWLYDSEWAKTRQLPVAALVAAVEERRGIPFAHADGKLVEIEDSDRILGAIAVTSRIFHIVDSRGA
jgi:hypothetical protein